MWRKLLFEHGLMVTRDAVMRAMRLCDSIGCQNRRKRRLLRRQYVNPGPNFCWHVDGYDKLKRYGFAIHGAICGFSRRILWLEVDVTNNDPKIVASYFLNYVKSVKFVPMSIRADNGTENILIEKTQKALMALSSDRNLDDCFLYGKSTANQRIEAWWSILRRQEADWWICLFMDMEEKGLLNIHDAAQMECLRFCFSSIFQSELHKIAILCNLHHISSKKHFQSVSGKPDVLYFQAESLGNIDLKYQYKQM